MITETIEYKNFRDEPRTKKLWFHMSKQDVLDNLSLKEQVEALQHIFEGEKRQISVLEITQILELVKRITKISYGVQSEDGERFKKGSANPEVWEAFFETPAYDQFIEGKFMPDPSKAFEFLLAVMPKDLRLEAEAEAKKTNPALYAEYEAALGQNPGATISVVNADPVAAAEVTNPVIRPVPRPNDMTREELEAALNAIKNR
jgi:hypothetical protein